MLPAPFSMLCGRMCQSICALLLLLLLPGTAVSAAESGWCDIDIDTAEVESSRSVDGAAAHRMDLAEFNAIIAEIPARQESWVMDPVRVVLEYLGTPGARSVSIVRCDAAGEAATQTSVQLLEDGYLDDALRGTLYTFVLEKDGAGRWLIRQGSEAYRCWRGHHQESYSEKNCS